ncbi:type IV pili twitching motility protein PilT [Lysobacteraceae bacterium NML95-0200]|nr:type IV pili twitching motility protein PilT [Xanthomonadaceae bacterium NML95-0200]
MDITPFLKLMVEKHGSDMFLSTGAPIHIKVEGRLHPLGTTNLPPGLVKRIAYSMMDKDQIKAFERDMEMNMAVFIPDIGRFRINVFQQRGEVGMVIRAIRTEIPSIDELQLPPVLRDIITRPRGLVLVVGSTGSGKSTTLASMIDHRNSTMSGHILTIEDPIEFLHRHKRSLVNQREVGIDTQSFHSALKNAMREAPDVILIGEILDAATMEAAIAFSETGHLCLATLHSNNADQALERILNFFPESAHKNILMNLSLNLHAVISQRLVKGKDGKRLPAVEVLINTPFVRDLMRRGEAHKIKQAMEESLSEQMQTFDQALFNLYKQGKIEMEEALGAADSRDGLELKFRLSEGNQAGHDPYADIFITNPTPAPAVAASPRRPDPFQFNALPDPTESPALMEAFSKPIPGITQGFDESNFNG